MQYIVNLVFREPNGETGWTWAESDEEADETVRVYENSGSVLVERWPELIEDID